VNAQAWAFLAAGLAPVAALALARRAVVVRGVGLADASSLSPVARRTELAAAALAVALAGALALAASLVRTPASTIGPLVPTSRTTVVVLDMSASISEFVYAEFARTLTLISSERGDAPIGLVLFSDVAQEALPPGTPARELRPFIRFFEPLREASARARPDYYRPGGPSAPAPVTYVLSPWYATFGGGTAISTGLAAAREMLGRDGVRDGAVLLVSDLDDKREDRAALTRELVAYALEGLRLDVVAVPPAYRETRELYESLAGSTGSLVDSGTLRALDDRDRAADRLPVGFMAVVVLVALLLGAYEAGAAPLAWRATRR
jgi:hypothetical protein